MFPQLAQPAAKPAVASFRDRLRRGAVKRAADNKATVHLPMEASEDGNYFVIKIPRNMSYADLRTKDSFIDEAGKLHKESAMVTVNTLGMKEVDYLMSFTDEEHGVRLDMQVRPNVTLNIACDYGTVKLFNSENGEPIEATD